MQGRFSIHAPGQYHRDKYHRDPKRVTNPDPTISDIRNDSWILRLAPAVARPYIRLARMDRPIGTWLLLLPCWWSVALASEGWPDIRILGLFAAGALVMRGAGCTINDIVDRDIDAQVARTAHRPIPGGEISVGRAVVFLVVLLVIGLIVLLQFNRFAVLLAMASLVPVFLYPFAKRVTNWPQLVLGVAINWGALVGWAAVRGTMEWPAVALYVGGIFWTLGYDTIYAYQDRNDDRHIGVKSTTFALGHKPRPWLLCFYTVALGSIVTGGSLAGGGLSGVSAPFLIGAGLCAAHLIWQVATLDIHTPGDCRAKFLSNRDFGLAVFVLLIVQVNHAALQ